MKVEKVVLEIRDKATSSTAKTKLTLKDGAYCTKINIIPEAYLIMLPGDTITIKYKQGQSIFEVDYTFPEARLKVDGAVNETGTHFDRIITYKSLDIPDMTLQRLYEDVRDNGEGYLVQGEVTVDEIWFYSNYLSRLTNVGKRNVVLVDSSQPGFQPSRM